MKKKSATLTVSKKNTKIKKVEVFTARDVQRYIGSVTEEFQGQVSAVAEQIVGLYNKIDTSVEMLNDKIDTSVEILNGKIDANTEMVARLMVDVEEIKIGMQEKVSKTEFNKLETRLVALESFVFAGHTKKAQKARKS